MTSDTPKIRGAIWEDIRREQVGGYTTPLCEPLASVSPPPKGGHGPLGPTPRGMVPMAPMAPKGTRNREVTHGRFPQDGTHGAHGHPLLWGQGVGPPSCPPPYIP